MKRNGSGKKPCPKVTDDAVGGICVRLLGKKRESKRKDIEGKRCSMGYNVKEKKDCGGAGGFTAAIGRKRKNFFCSQTSEAYP